MFRKPKKSGKKAGTRRKSQEEVAEEDQEDVETSQELAHARKRAKTATYSESTQEEDSTRSNKKEIMHTYERAAAPGVSQQDLATRTNELHPTKTVDRGNKLLAGPIKAPTNIRTTCRFDYQPDICKDYKDTGFCGFGDTCIYLHDRGDTLSGWQLEQKWQQEQDEKKKRQKEQMDAFLDASTNGGKAKENISIGDHGLPFACHFCRGAFKDPVVTNCEHYFCESCIMKHVKETSPLCPICNKDTHGVFHQPTKLLGQKRKLCGRQSSWQDFLDAHQPKSTKAA